MHMSTGGILQGRIKLQPAGKHMGIPKFELCLEKPSRNDIIVMKRYENKILLPKRNSKTINQWDAPKSIDTCQDWLQLFTGGITQDALHMHSATVALVAAPTICCLHLNILIHFGRSKTWTQNAHRSDEVHKSDPAATFPFDISGSHRFFSEVFTPFQVT